RGCAADGACTTSRTPASTSGPSPRARRAPSGSSRAADGASGSGRGLRNVAFLKRSFMNEVFSVAALVFLLGQDQGRLGDGADAAGAEGDALQGPPPGLQHGHGSFTEAA